MRLPTSPAVSSPSPVAPETRPVRVVESWSLAPSGLRDLVQTSAQKPTTVTGVLRVSTIHGGSPSGGGGSNAAGAVAQYLTGYLTAAGEEPGIWVGAAAHALALEGQVQRSDLVSVLEGRDPRDGTALGRLFQCRTLGDGRVVRPVIGFDATFSAPKSVSVMWALTRDAGWAEAHDRAVHAVVEHVQARGATTRVRVPGGRVFPDTRGLIVAVFRQHTSRADDPQLHTHTFISSKVQTADGGWWALDARYLKRYQRALGGLYQTVLRAELTARYGVEWGPVVNGQAELAHLPAVLVEVFSKRTTQVDETLDVKVEAFTVRNGRVPTGYERAALVREAALDSRDRKTGNEPGVLFEQWTVEAARVGWDRDRLTAVVVPVGQVRDAHRAVGSLGAVAVTQDWLGRLGEPDGLFDRVTETVSRASTWHRGDVLRAVTDHAVPPAVMAGERWSHLVETIVDDYLQARCLSLDPPQPTGGRVRDTDGRVVSVDPMVGCWTTGAILAQEEHLLVWALDHTPNTPTPSTTTPRDLGNGTRLDPDQHAAAAAVAGTDGLVLVVGPAGTGKTSTLAAAVTDLEQHGRPVFGVAPSNQAAHILASETGMGTDSVAKLLYEHTRPDRDPGPTWRLPAGATVVVDEAGMLATGDLHQLTVLADRWGWRLVLVGDPYQLPPVGRGGMFAELAHHTTPIELGRVRRFTNDWEGPASLALRRAEPGVIATYEHHDRIQAGTFDGHTDVIVRAWLDHTGHGHTVAITAATNDEVDRLNTAIQTARLERGDLNPDLAVTGGHGDRLHPGDVVATRRNDRTLTTDRGVIVKNRALWTVTHTQPDTGTATLTGPDGTIALPGDYVAEHVRVAYANTVYGTQGATVDHAITLVSGATDHRNLYVGATRGRHTNQLHVIADSPEDARGVLEAALARDRVDTPAVTVRRDLLHQTETGRTAVMETAERTPTTVGGHGDTDEPAALIAGRTSDPPDLVPSDPFAGLETVGEALERVLAEQAERNAPRERYGRLQGELAQARYEREQLDKPRGPYVRTPLDEAHRAVNNAHADVNMLTTRYQHTSWRQRRSVGRDLEHARERLETAKAGLEEQYQHHAERLDKLIDTTMDRLERHPRPEPVGPRDRELERSVGWLRWEVSVGNNDRPTVEALEERKVGFDRLSGRGHLTHGERAVYRAVAGELGDRDLQHREAVAASEAARARLQVRSVGRDVGPDLGL